MWICSWNKSLHGTVVEIFFELIFDDLREFHHSPVLEPPLRQKAPWDLTLTCRTLTSYWARSLVRIWRSKSHGRSKSSGGFICSDPRSSSQANRLPERQSAWSRTLHPKPRTHLVSPAPLCSAWFGLESCPLSLRPGSGDVGGGRRWREEVGGHWGRGGGGRRSAAGRWEEEEGAVAWTSPPPAAYATAYSPCWGSSTGERKKERDTDEVMFRQRE